MAVNHNNIFIVGNGRSGTNWLVDIFDSSPLTHCRVSPGFTPNSPYHNLPTPQDHINDMPLMAKRWDEFIQWTNARIGERDHQIETPKRFVYNFSWVTGLATHYSRPKVRKALQIFHPDLGKNEWKLPWWVGNQRKLEETCTVVKLDSPTVSWIMRWVLENDQDSPIIHLVRHPGGFLNSGISRFFSKISEAELASEYSIYKNFLETVKSLNSQWSEMLGNVDGKDLLEIVLWYWRYTNETLYLAGKSRSNYLQVIYEDLARDPLSKSKEIYEFCGVSWDQSVENFVLQGTGQSRWGPIAGTSKTVSDAWKKKLSDEHRYLVEKVFDGSFMQSWWKD